MKRRILSLLAALTVLSAAAACGIWLYIGREGSSAIERWVGRYILSVIQSYLTADIDFGALDYRAPRTIIIDDLVLTSGGQVFVSIDRATLELAEIPKRGRPVLIQRIELDSPDFRFLRAPDDGFVGWTGLVRPRVIADPQSVPEGKRLSDTLVLRHVTVRDGRVTYKGGDQPYTLPGIELALDTPPRPDQPGWYELGGTFERAPLFRVAFDGRINLDTATLVMKNLEITATMGQQVYDTLEFHEREVLRSHDLRGDLTASLQGQIPLKSPAQATAKAQLSLRDASIAFGDTVWPVARFAADAELASGQLAVGYSSRLLSGRANGTAIMAASPSPSLDLTWVADGIEMADTLRVVQNGEPRYQGRIKTEGELSVAYESGCASVNGRGEMMITEGKLVNLAIIKSLLAVVDKTRSYIGMSAKPRDAAWARFAIAPEYIELTEMEILASLVGIRGKGHIYYDGSLDLNVYAGMVSKLQRGILYGILWIPGKLANALSAGMLSYRVTGTGSRPKITPKPLGLGK